MNLQLESGPKLLGAGRSGEVYLVEAHHHLIARKVFQGDTLTKLVHYVFFGAPTPYIWNEDAIQCAYYRRRILAELVPFWFEDRLAVADAFSSGWNAEQQAYQLDTAFSPGSPVALCQPFAYVRRREMPVLVHQIMQPLQKYLLESGFDGLVWQAGKGNPVALNNFLLTHASPADKGQAMTYRFVWIDLESGVPALAPLNVLTLFTFYIPKSFQHQRPLFDDVDTARLKAYISTYAAALEDFLGPEKYQTLVEEADALAAYQAEWKALGRRDRNIQYQMKKGKITSQQANWYADHPLQWYGRELVRAVQTVARKLVVDLPVKVFGKLSRIEFGNMLVNAGKLLISQRYRLQVTHDFLCDRIDVWCDRKQLTEEEADHLKHRLRQEASADYLVDFSIYLAIKVIVYGSEVAFLPILYAAGIVNEATAALIVMLDGPIFRSAYTIYRMIQNGLAGKEVPWVAFWIGIIPFVGNIAYPCQVIYSSAGKEAKLARFIVYDSFTRLGGKIPIWGGEDTLTEHFFNRTAYQMIRGMETYFKRHKGKKRAMGQAK
ncbi:MAG: hypothetical protein ICV62_01140 [Cyanobacteria bacterium Co-bin13]|nr:hypothetical protein [Cyanobacteria bacterium Co-bin13]